MLHMIDIQCGEEMEEPGGWGAVSEKLEFLAYLMITFQQMRIS